MKLKVIPLVLLVTACASAGTNGQGASAPRGSRDVITQAEVEATDVSTVLDLIRRLRPEYLRARGGGASIGPVVFYLDGVKQQSVDALQTISKEIVREVRYLNATDATMRFGTDHTAGAVLVSTRR